MAEAAAHPHPHPFPPLHPTVYAGTFVHLQCRTRLYVREHGLVGVDARGRIEFVAERLGREDARAGGAAAAEEWVGDHEQWIEEEVKRHGWGSRIRASPEGEDVEGALAEGGGKRGWVLVCARRGEWWFPGFVGE